MANLNRDLTILLHMQNYCEEVLETMEKINKDFQMFEDEYIYRNSISMDILQIGELANHLSNGYIENTKNIMDWHAITGMRNRFAHGYFDMNHRIIFDTALKDIPVLNKFLLEQIKALQ